MSQKLISKMLADRVVYSDSAHIDINPAFLSAEIGF